MKNGQYERREGALERLEVQLKKGNKPEKLKGKFTNKMIELGDKDKTRIASEIKVLKERTI